MYKHMLTDIYINNEQRKFPHTNTHTHTNTTHTQMGKKELPSQSVCAEFSKIIALASQLKELLFVVVLHLRTYLP